LHAKIEDTSWGGKTFFRDGNRKDQAEQGQYQPHSDAENNKTEEKPEEIGYSRPYQRKGNQKADSLPVIGEAGGKK
jgi:hypothetical protein